MSFCIVTRQSWDGTVLVSLVTGSFVLLNLVNQREWFPHLIRYWMEVLDQDGRSRKCSVLVELLLNSSLWHNRLVSSPPSPSLCLSPHRWLVNVSSDISRFTLDGRKLLPSSLPCLQLDVVHRVLHSSGPNNSRCIEIDHLKYFYLNKIFRKVVLVKYEAYSLFFSPPLAG